MMKQNKGKLLISSLVILLPAAIGLLLWDALPEQIAIHWGLQGTADSRTLRGLVVFAPPVILLVFHWICLLITAADPRNRNQSPKALGMLFWIVPLLSLYTGGLIYGTAFGMPFHTGKPISLLIGFLFLLLGNYFPKCRQNSTLGIKIKWTLENEENWNQTHRFGGRVWVGGGLLLLLSVFLPVSAFHAVFLLILLFIAFAPMIYSYLYHRKQVREGTAISRDGGKCGQSSSSFSRLSGILSAVTLIAVGILLFSGTIQVRYDDTSFTIEASYWPDLTVSYEDIEAAELRSQDTPGSRTYGFGSLRLLMGTFRNDEFGSYTRYSYTGGGSCIVLTVAGQTLVIGGESEEATQAIYEELMTRVPLP